MTLWNLEPKYLTSNGSKWYSKNKKKKEWVLVEWGVKGTPTSHKVIDFS